MLLSVQFFRDVILFLWRSVAKHVERTGKSQCSVKVSVNPHSMFSNSPTYYLWQGFVHFSSSFLVIFLPPVSFFFSSLFFRGGGGNCNKKTGRRELK